jgi:general nucleoside transport system permease protein
VRVLRSETFATFAGSTLAAAFALAVALLIVALSGESASEAANAFFEGAFGSSDATLATLNVMVPLALIGLAWIIASSANQINLGLEGQILVGGIFATLAGTEITGLPQAIHLPLALAAGALGGALYAGIPALLSVYRNVPELLSTFMLNFVAILAVSWLVRGPLQDPTTSFLLQSSPVELSASWPRVGTSQLSWDIILVPMGVAIVALVLARTTLGFRLKLLGANPDAAREAGVATVRLGAGALIVSGAIAGLVGASLILASTGGVLTDGFSNNYGFLGIAVALLARNSPVGCVAAALLFAGLQQGGGLVETRIGVSSSLVAVTQGVVIIILAGSALFLGRFWPQRLSLGRPLAVEEG